MLERLWLVGGGLRWLNIHSAMKIGGFKKPDEIYGGIRRGDFEINEEICPDREHPEKDDCWIQVEPASYIEWLEKRHNFSLDKIEKRYENIIGEFSGIHFKLACIQHEVNRMQSELNSFRQLVFDNLRELGAIKSGRGKGVKAPAKIFK